MASRVPTSTLVNWSAVGLQLLVLLSLVLLAGSLGVAPLFGVVVYLLWSWTGRLVVPKDHRRSVMLIKAGRFEDAIPFCEASIAWFERYPWVDRYRAFVLLSSSAWSYREMAFANRAFSLGQLGRGSEAIQAYEAMLLEFPDSVLARTALNLMRAARQA